jgi:hypothetical protein
LGGGDAIQYHQLGRWLLAGKGLDNVMFGLRPPAFPFMVAGIYALAGKEPHVVVFFQMILGALTVALAAKLAARLTCNTPVAWLTGILAAAEVAHLDATITLMSEPLHNFCLYAGLYWLVVAARRPAGLSAARAVVGSALLLSGAFLARPQAVYVPLLMAGVLVVFRRGLWRRAALLAALCALPFLLWSYRNWVYTGNFVFSATGSFTPLFYKTVAVESHATGRDPAEVAIDIKLELERRLGRDVTRDEVAGYAVGQPEDLFAVSAERAAVERQMVLERALRYPVWSAILTGVSLIRQFDASDVPLPAALQIGVTTGELSLALAGLVVVWRQRRARRLLLLISAALIGYYAGSTAWVLAGLYHTRFRAPYMPLILIFTAYGLVWLARRLGNRFNAQPPATPV